MQKLYKPDEELRATIQRLKKRVRVLSDKLRRPKIRKTLILSRGFKKKGAKSKAESVTDLNSDKKPQLIKSLIKSDKSPIMLARLNAERNDYIQLKKMLRDEKVTADLTILTQIATDCSERQ